MMGIYIVGGKKTPFLDKDTRRVLDQSIANQMLTLPLIYGPQCNNFYRVCVCVYVCLSQGKGVALDLALPPVENPDPIGHDAQSAAEMLK